MFGSFYLAAMMYVLTGGPSVGKTSILHELEKQGEPVIHEAATDLIGNMLRRGIKEFWKEEHFDLNILQIQLEREGPFLDKQGRVFIDRGVFDGHTYVTYHGMTNTKTFALMKEALENIDLNERYAAVFYVLPYSEEYIHKTCEVRKEDETEAKELQAALYKTYSKHKKFVVVPGNLSPKERANYILEQVRRIEASSFQH